MADSSPSSFSSSDDDKDPTRGLLIFSDEMVVCVEEKFGVSVKVPTKSLLKKYRFHNINHNNLDYMKIGLGYQKVANIRRSSGKPGEISWRQLKFIDHVIVLDDYTAQKKWYLVLVKYKENYRGGHDETLYMYFDSWTLNKLIQKSKDRVSDNNNSITSKG